jgi:hypothetical protein
MTRRGEYSLHVVEIGRRAGKRYVNRHPVNVPLHVVTGSFELLSDLQLREISNDLAAERDRRLAE